MCIFVYRVVRPRLTIYVCQESQQVREQQQKHENGDGSSSAFFGERLNLKLFFFIKESFIMDK